jgi:hypothetical protein
VGDSTLNAAFLEEGQGDAVHRYGNSVMQLVAACLVGMCILLLSRRAAALETARSTQPSWKNRRDMQCTGKGHSIVQSVPAYFVGMSYHVAVLEGSSVGDSTLNAAFLEEGQGDAVHRCVNWFCTVLAACCCHTIVLLSL